MSRVIYVSLYDFIYILYIYTVYKCICQGLWAKEGNAEEEVLCQARETTIRSIRLHSFACIYVYLPWSFGHVCPFSVLRCCWPDSGPPCKNGKRGQDWDWSAHSVPGKDLYREHQGRTWENWVDATVATVLNREWIEWDRMHLAHRGTGWCFPSRPFVSFVPKPLPSGEGSRRTMGEGWSRQSRQLTNGLSIGVLGAPWCTRQTKCSTFWRAEWKPEKQVKASGRRKLGRLWGFILYSTPGVCPPKVHGFTHSTFPLSSWKRRMQHIIHQTPAPRTNKKDSKGTMPRGGFCTFDFYIISATKNAATLTTTASGSNPSKTFMWHTVHCKYLSCPQGSGQPPSIRIWPLPLRQAHETST